MKTDLVSCPEFKFDIRDIKPVSPYKTVSTIDCNLNLDFEAPLDYEEPAPQPALDKKTNSNVVMDEEKLPEGEFNAFSGKFQRLDGKSIKDEVIKKKEEYDPRKCRLHNGVRKAVNSDPFSGKGLRLNARA